MTAEPEGATPASVADHRFIAEPWWRPCRVCGLAMPSHTEVFAETAEAMRAELERLPYRCPTCVVAAEFHRSAPHNPGECPRGESA